MFQQQTFAYVRAALPAPTLHRPIPVHTRNRSHGAFRLDTPDSARPARFRII